MSRSVRWPSFRWLWASIVMHNKRNVNQPSRSSTINAVALFLFYMGHISLKQGHLSLPGARTRLLSGCCIEAMLSLTLSLSLCVVIPRPPPSLSVLCSNTVPPHLTFQDTHSQEASVEKLHHGVLWLLTLPDKKRKTEEEVTNAQPIAV